MKQLLACCLAIFVFYFNSYPALAENFADELPECIVVTHCELQTWEVRDVKDSFEKVIAVVTNTPRTKIVEKTDSFLHAEAKTKWRRYTDDLLVKAYPELGLIQVRSESRVGIGDKGVNKKRIEDLAYRLTTNQIN